MNEKLLRVVADSKDWYFDVYFPLVKYADAETNQERQLGKAVEALLAAEKVLPPGIRVIRETPIGPVLDEPYVLQPTDTGWRPHAPEA